MKTPTFSNARLILLWGTCLTGLLFAGACDNSLDPIDTEKGIYSIYGFVDINAEENYVRVKDLNIPLVDDTTQFTGATVTLTNTENLSETEVLEEVTVDFDSVKTHNFRAEMNIRPHTTYRVKVAGDDGRSVSATATTPGIAEYSAEPTGQKCNVPITFRFNPVREGNFILMYIRFFVKGKPEVAPYILKPQGGEAVLVRSPNQIITDATRQMYSCIRLSDAHLYVDFTHFGPDFDLGADNTNISDSLAIPGGTGTFLGILRDSLTVPIELAL